METDSVYFYSRHWKGLCQDTVFGRNSSKCVYFHLMGGNNESASHVTFISQMAVGSVRRMLHRAAALVGSVAASGLDLLLLAFTVNRAGYIFW